MMRKIIYITFIIIYNAVLAQANSNQNLQLPTIIPPSPTAQNFMRYGEIPVDYSTGVPKIEIPIYTIKGKQLELPISISYHASGIKVNDISSEIGLGWVLNAGGIITRTINGRRDEIKSRVRTYSNSTEMLNYLNDHVYDYECSSASYKGIMDFETFITNKFVDEEDEMNDRYFYSISSGKSGVFTYDYSELNNSENTVVTLPYQPIKIKATLIGEEPTDKEIKKIEITDEYGIVYTFESFFTSASITSEWYLTSMISADGKESIKFNYVQQTPASAMIRTSFMYRGSVDNYNNMTCVPSDLNSSLSNIGSVIPNFTTPILTSIESNNEILKFEYDSRTDFSMLKRLNRISISSINEPNRVVEVIQFYEKYFGATNENKRLGLDYLTKTFTNNPEIEKYTFIYNERSVLPPYPQKMPSMRFSEDFWGYYNGQDNVTNIQREYIRNSSDQLSKGGIRDADLTNQYASACMLQEIKYPAGGKTIFEYDRYYSDNLYPYRELDWEKKGYLGGFRVRKISNYKSDNDSFPEIKSYEYSGERYNLPHFKYFRKSQRFIEKKQIPTPLPGENNFSTCYPDYTVDMVSSDPIFPMDIACGLPIVYTTVTEYRGTNTENSGKIVYHYNEPYSPSNFESNEHPLEWEKPIYYHSYHFDKGNYVPSLIEKHIYNNQDKKIYSEINHYKSYFNKIFNTGIKLTRDINYQSPKLFSGIFASINSGCCQCTSPSSICEVNLACKDLATTYKNSIISIDTKAIQEANLLDYTVKRTYDQNDVTKYIEDRIDYTYNQHNLMINQTSRKNSLGENIVTKYKYPYDFGTNQPYQTMLSKNILTPVVEQVTTNENKQVQKIQTTYKDWGNNIIEPEIIKAQTASQTPLENKIRYLSYDSKGNPVSIKKEKGTPITYLWGYDKTLPIAMVENAAYVYQSSTEDQSQQASYSGLQINPGNTSYELGNITISEEKSYPVERSYERDYSQYSVIYQLLFQHDSNSAYNVTFTDTAPTNQNSIVVETSVNLKPGIYTVKLVNVGYNGYTGKISHDININIRNIAEIKKEIPFHTSFEDDIQNVNTSYSITGKKSHVGSYIVKIPPSSMGLNKVIVSYWGKASDSSEWKYVETILDANGQNYTVGLSDAYVDEVRLYPVDAMMTTYTYDPFYKQLTSVMKPNNQAEYYIYDKKGRLEKIIDVNGNILKEYQYNYKQ